MVYSYQMSKIEYVLVERGTVVDEPIQFPTSPQIVACPACGADGVICGGVGPWGRCKECGKAYELKKVEG